MGVTLTPMRSSNVVAAGYDAAAEAIIVRFTGGGTYRYAHCARSTWDALRAAGSKGAFVSRVLRGSPAAHPVTKLPAAEAAGYTVAEEQDGKQD